MKVGHVGILFKLDALLAFLRFLKVHVLADTLYTRVTLTEVILVRWKRTLRKEKRKLRKSQLQRLSAESLSLDEVSALLECLIIWLIKPARTLRGKKQWLLADWTIPPLPWLGVFYKELAEAWSNSERYTEGIPEKKCLGEKSLYVMSTVLEGFAKTVLQTLDHARVTQYIGTVRRLQDIKNESQNLFVLTGGKAIQNLSTKVKKL